MKKYTPIITSIMLTTLLINKSPFTISAPAITATTFHDEMISEETSNRVTAATTSSNPSNFTKGISDAKWPLL